MESEGKVIFPQGWRGTLGFIIPAELTTNTEHEYRYLLPEGIGIVCQRAPFGNPKTIDEYFGPMHQVLPDAARILKDAKVDVVCFGCTGGTFTKGREHELHLADVITKASGLPAITAAGAVADAIRFMGAEKVVVIGPYSKLMNELLVKYLKEDQKIGVHFVYERIELDRSQPPWRIYPIVLDAWRASPPGGDLIFFSCGATRLVEVIPLLEAETGVPVLSTNLSVIWRSLQVLGVHSPIQGKGKLLDRPR